MTSERAEGTSGRGEIKVRWAWVRGGGLETPFYVAPSLSCLPLSLFRIHNPQLLWKEPGFRVSPGFESRVCHSLTGCVTLSKFLGLVTRA